MWLNRVPKESTEPNPGCGLHVIAIILLCIYFILISISWKLDDIIELLRTMAQAAA